MLIPMYVHAVQLRYIFLVGDSSSWAQHTSAITNTFLRFNCLCAHFIHLLLFGFPAKFPCSLTQDLPNASTSGI